MANFAIHLSGGAANTNPFASNGGSISNTVIEHDKLNNLWPEVTAAQADVGWQDGKIVYWKNTDSLNRKATQIRVYFRQVDNFVTMSVSDKPPNTPEEVLPVIPPPEPPEVPPPTSHGEKLSYQSEQLEASSQEAANVIANINDNNLGTWWSNGQSLPGWCKIDFQQKKRVNLLKIAWYRGNERVIGFNIQLSDDDSSYTTVFTGSSSGATLTPEVYEFADKDARYIKINVTSNSQISRAAITEVEVWGSNTTIAGPQQPPGGNPPPGQVPGRPVEYQTLYTFDPPDPGIAMKCHNGEWKRVGMHIDNSFSPMQNFWPHKVEFKLRKVGSPTGNIVAKVWRMSDNFVLGEIQSKDVSTIPTTAGFVAFENTNTFPNLLSAGMIVGLEYLGGDANNYVEVIGTWTKKTEMQEPVLGQRTAGFKSAWELGLPDSELSMKVYWNRGPCGTGAAATEGFSQAGYTDEVLSGNIEKPHSYETGIPLPDLLATQWKGIQLVRTVPNATEKAVNVGYELVLECKFV